MVEASRFWYLDTPWPKGVCPGCDAMKPPHVHTLEGPLGVSPGDWIVVGIHGECYPVKHVIFEKTYEATAGDVETGSSVLEAQQQRDKADAMIAPIPNRITVKVYPDEETPGMWIAEIPEMDQMTCGGSVSNAVFMASDLLRLLGDECEHCWCRRTEPDDERPVGAECCWCGTWSNQDWLHES